MKTFKYSIPRILFLFAGLLFSFSVYAQPANDGCLNAQSVATDGTCVNGTTVGANDSWSGVVGCQAGAPNSHEDVWYSFVATGTNFSTTVTAGGTWTDNIEVVLANGSCIGGFLVVTSSCGASPLTVTATGLIVGTTYYFTVSNTGAGTNGTFQVCTTNSTPAANCTDNDDCNTPTPITFTPDVQTCLTDCNTGAAPGPDFAGNNCYDYPEETVWYQVTTSGSSAFLNIALTSTALTLPYFTVFTTTNCTNYTIVNCTQGAGGVATNPLIPVSPNTTYLIAISDGGGATGNFQLCVTVENDNSACNTSDQLSVSATSMGSPLTGPFQAGEIVTFCYNINNWQQVNCNYLQAIIPTFGDCWDPVSFNAQGRPVTITTALQTAGVIQPCGIGPPCAWNACVGTPSGTWSWMPTGSATYNNITGSLPPGTDVGAGWFFLSSYNPATGSCTGDPTDPDNSYGDGNFPACGTNTLDWQVCFQLQARGNIACTNGQTDCSVSMKTYADGEIGTWTDVGCTADNPAVFTTTLTCCVPPVANAGADIAICSGASGSIGAAAAAGMTYSWSPATGLSSATSSNPTVTLTNAGTTNIVSQYVVTQIETATGCSDTDTILVTVRPLPTATSTPAAQTICSGGTTALNLTSNLAGTTFTWTSAASAGTITGNTNGAGASIAETLTNSGSTSGTVTYTITPVANGCTGSTTTAVVTVNPTPVATATPAASTICSGQTTSVALTSTVAGTTFTWTASGSAGTLGGFSNSSGSTIAQTLTNSATTAGTVTYTITPTAASCPGATTTATVTVNPIPAATATPATATICSGATTAVNLTANVAGTTFTWAASGSAGTIGGFANGSGSSIAQTLTNSGTTAGTVTYTITPTAATCVGSTTTATITVNPTPAATATPAASTICSGGTTSIALTSNVAGSTFAWTASGSAGTITGFANGTGSTIAQTISNSGTTSGTVTYTITPTAASCPGATTTATVTVNPRPTGTATPATATICSGATTAVNLTSNVAATTYTWTVTGTAGTSGFSNGSGNSIAQTLTTTGTTAGTVTYTITPIAAGCTGNTFTATITVNPSPAATATPASSTICPNGTTAINLTSNVAGTTFAWTASGSAGTGGFANGTGSSIAQTLTNSGSTAGTVTYTITPTAAGCPGATTTATVTINPRPTATATPATSTICSGASTSVALTSNVAGTTYTWTATSGAGTISGFANGSGSTIAQTLTNTGATAAVTYTITPTAGTCVGATITATVNVTGISVTTGTTNTNCGAATGTATATPSGGTGVITYSWSTTPVQTTQTATGLAAGPYNITITDANGCTASGVATVNSNNAPTVNITSITHVLCNGNSTGSITASASGGTGALTYTWNTTPVQTGVTASNLAAGTYVVTVVDAANCSASTSAVVNQPAALSVVLTKTDVACNGASTGSATATMSGGTGAMTYSWSTTPSQTTATATNLAAGTYTVAVTDNNNCLLDTTIAITQPALLTATITDSTLVSCNGGNNGSATVTANGGTGAYTYSWNTTPSVSTPIAGTLTAGTYSVTVTDANGCTASTGVVITQPAVLNLTATSVNASCAGNDGEITLSATGGVTPYEFSNNNGSTYQASGSFTALSAGIYFVYVRDANLCTDSTSVTITAGGNLISTITASTNVTCNSACDGSATVTTTGGTGTYTYNWNTTPAQTTPAATGLCAGTYTVTVSENTGSGVCQDTATVIITEPAALNATTSTTSATCGASNGTATVSATGGSGTYTYSWNTSPSQSTATATGLGAGNYQVTVTDSLGCTFNVSAQVTTPSGLALSITDTVNVSCFGGSDGGATATASGGTGAFTYLWTPGAVASNVLVGVPAGTYTITVTDGAGCSIVDSVIITEPAGLTSSTTTTDVLCNGGSTGMATVAAAGGTPGYAYSWSTGVLNDTLANIPAGTYNYTVSDTNGCTSTGQVTINEPAALSLTLAGTNPLCFNDLNGSAAVASISGGTGAFTYSWNNGTLNDSIINVGAGQYILVVTDANNCSVQDTVDLINPSAITATTTVTNVSCFGGNNGTATVNASGGTGSLSFSWNSVPVQTNQTATGLTAGVYTVTVTDVNNCIFTQTATVTEPSAPLFVNATATAATCSNLNNGQANASVSGGTLPYTYSWNTGASTINATNLSAGTYTLAVADANGCVAADTAVVTSPSAIVAGTSSLTASCGLADGQATITASGGTGTLSFSWLGTSVTASTITGIPAGTYQVSVIDANGCGDTLSAEVFQQAAPVSSFTATPTEGLIPLTVSFNNSSSNSNTFFWNFGNDSTNVTTFNPTMTYVNEGDYVAYLIVTSGGCSDSSAVTIKVTGPSKFEIPNVFTPDGDNQNDLFTVISENIAEMKMQIYNRWGELLFDETGANVYWDGNTMSGTQAPAGTYYYSITATGTDKKVYGPLRGFILLNRK